jgi:hypothetical protein
MWWLGLFLLIGTAALLIALGKSGRRLVTPFAPRGGVSLQLANSPAFADSVIRSWEKAGVIRLARRQIYLDFVLIVFYSSLLVFACAELQWSLPDGGGPYWRSFALAGEVAAVLAALCDATENFGMLDLIATFRRPAPLRGALTKLVFVSASSKFILIALSAAAALTLFITLAITRVLS